MAHTYEHPQPSVTVDAVILKYVDENLSILLIQRGNEPFKDHWALPGGFLDMEESPIEAVGRELQEETGLKINYFIEIGAFGDPHRDPRGRVISISFLAIVKGDSFAIKAGSDAYDAKWFGLYNLPDKLAFDHQDIIKSSILLLKKELKLALVEKQYGILNLSHDEIMEVNTIISDFSH